MKKLVDESNDGSFIAFIDSRQGAERIAAMTDDALVQPYRSGYETVDRTAIERALRDGCLRGVVSTSALELGIDIPHFVVGLNIGAPASRKSFRQRLGRVGRQQPGGFGILDEPYAFKRFGTTLNEYYQASVEPSYLYLCNRFMQYAHARCLAEELEILGVTGKKVPPSIISWPDGFAEVFDFSYPGSPSARPKEFDSIAQIGGDQPHFNYPLRNIPEAAFKVVQRRGGIPSEIGNPLNLQQAIREAYPGAIYLHMAKGYQVHEWRNTAFERTIQVSPTKSLWFPKPFMRTFVNLSLGRDGLVERRFREGENGFLAECHLQIIERVEGFRRGGEKNLYKDLRHENPGMSPKTRDFRTTGVVVKIETSWFREKSVKERVAKALLDLMLREYSISPRDVYSATTNIALIRDGQRKSVSDAIVFYDVMHGSLRLTEPAYLRFNGLLDQLERSVKMAPIDHDLLPSDIVSGLRQWFEQIGEPSLPPEPEPSSGPEGWRQVFAKGSVVAQIDTKGVHRDIEITGYEFVEIEDRLQLFYRHKTNTTGSALVSAEKVKPIGDDWSMVWWNPETGETRESLDDSED